MFIVIFVLAIVFFFWLKSNDFRLWYLDLSKVFPQLRKPALVGEYYDTWTEKYLEIYGDVIQGHRPENKNQLLDYIQKSSGMKSGMKILDAGGGVGGPAIYFATNLDLHIEMITISDVQATKARQKIEERSLQKRIIVTVGDFHQLENYYSSETFDMVIFLESYGHASNQAKVLQSVSRVLKHNGIIYIKDYFKNYLPGDSFQKKLTHMGISNMNNVYLYNTPDLYHTIYSLRQLCFELVLIKSPDFENWDEFKVIMEFQKKHGIDLLEGKQDDMRQHYVLPYELIFRKSKPLH